MMHRIVHKTIYTYTDNAEVCHNLVHLQPRMLPWQPFVRTELVVDPLPDRIHRYSDYFGNHVHGFAVYRPHLEMTIAAETVVRIADRVSAPVNQTPPWNDVVTALERERSPEITGALEHRFDSPYVATSDTLREFAIEHFAPNRPLAEASLALAKAIHREFQYDPEATTIDTSLVDVLERRRGVCQDFAHLFIGGLRSLGLACRYVSGYLRTDPRPGQPRLTGVDASHAWVSVFCPGLDWIDFDPTNGCMVNDRHITIGWGRDFHDVSPVKGIVLGGGQATLKVAVDVDPI